MLSAAAGVCSNVLSAIVPLYVAMIMAYVSVKYLRMFTPDQCAGINKFVSKFSVPLLSFRVISTTNPYKINMKLAMSDLLQKILAFMALFLVAKTMSPRSRFDLVITGVSLSTLPNTLIVGIPLLKALYGAEAAALLAQIVLLQSLVWYNLLLLMFELNSAVAISASPSPQVPGEPEAIEQEQENERGANANSRPTTKRKLMVTFRTVGQKLILNPNTHATFVGFIWACVSFRWHVRLPTIISNSVSILADGGLGMAMFSLGIFMASHASIIGYGARTTLLAIVLKFAAGPALMAASSVVVGLKGTLLRVAILQAALPQGIVPFVFAQEYNVHPKILSKGIIFGMLLAIPIALAYYFLLPL